MPFDLPPPVPPVQAEVRTLEAQADTARAADNLLREPVGRYELLISGNRYLDSARIHEVVSQANTPSQAVRFLNALYAAEGHPLVNLAYAADGETIHVHVNEGRITAVQAPPMLRGFFEDVIDKNRVTRRDLEPGRLLAGIKAGRAGHEVEAHYEVDEANRNRYTLVLEQNDVPDYQPVEWTTTFGNPGNRFLGRYFGFTDLSAKLPNGDMLGAGYGTAFTGLGDPRNGTDYDNYRLSYSTVNAWGLYSLEGSYTEYGIEDRFNQRLFDNEREEAEILDVRLNGSQFLHADNDTRLILEEQLQYVDSTVDFTEGRALTNAGSLGLAGTSVQEENYGAARVGLTASQDAQLFGRPLHASAGAGYKRGLGGHVDNLISTDRTADFDVYDANFVGRYTLAHDWQLSLHGKGQLSDDDTVPEQQQWVLGGSDNLAAFLPGTLFGDTGMYGRFQVQTPRWSLFSRPLRLAAFIEGGTAEFENRGTPTTTASDYGLKLEYSPLPHVELAAYVADSLSTSHIDDVYGDGFAERNEADFFFNVTTRF
jgi:hypothetical protein